MKYVREVPRIFLGLVFLAFGIIGLFKLGPQPVLEGQAGVFFAGLAASGYIMVLVKLVEVVAGALLLANRFVPLALTLLTPILINIAGFHFVLAPEPSSIVMVVLLFASELYLAWSYRGVFAPMLAAKAPRTEGQVSHAANRAVPAS